MSQNTFKIPTLEDATLELLKLSNALEKEVPLLEKLETEYYKKYHEYLFQALERTEALREAGVRLRLNTEGLAEPYQDQKLRVRLLLTKKEMWIEISKNLRYLRTAIDK